MKDLKRLLSDSEGYEVREAAEVDSSADKGSPWMARKSPEVLLNSI